MKNDHDRLQSSKTITDSLLFGSVSGTITAILLQPLDRIKTLMQEQHRLGLYGTTKRVIIEEGIVQFWRGLTPTLIRVVPGLSLYFSLIQTSRVYFVDPKNGFENFMVGMCCRSVAATIMQPATVIKTKLESSHYIGLTMTSVSKQVFTEQKFRGFWAGLFPTILRDAPFSGLYLMFYRQQLEFYIKNKPDIKPLDRFLCGLSAGFVACFITHPFDVLKTTAQLYPKDYLSMISAIKVLFVKSGIRSFYAGFIPRVLRRTLTAALNWTIFDELQKRVF
uniref:Mitochondrial carrier protein n=1 Tax=Panagrolaimus sp. JU765 TaxID=591449 RepID=A0AC34QTP6_9BILA